MKKLQGYKTYILSGLAILTAWLTFLVGDCSMEQAIAATFAALGFGTIRHAITTNGVKSVLILLILPLLLCLPACTSTDGKPGIVYDLTDGVCVQTADKKWSACYNPFTNVATAKSTHNGVTVKLTYDTQTKTWRGFAPGSGGELVYDKASGLRVEPVLPVESAK